MISSRRPILTALLIAVFCLVSLINVVPAQAEVNTWYCTSNLNLRATASTSGTVLFTMQSGSIMLMIGSYSNGFYNVRAWDPGTNQWRNGWASASYMTNNTAPYNQNSSSLYVYQRSGNSWVDSGYRLPVGAAIFYKDYYGSLMTIPVYSQSDADYTHYNKYYDTSEQWSPVDPAYVYGRYRVSGPSNYWMLPQ